MKNYWNVSQHSEGYWSADWTGPGPRTIGPYGECVGVLNTSQARALSCCDTFNEYQSRIDRAQYHLDRAAECVPGSCAEWIALNAARNAATGAI
jgi:hypothetical protein